MQCICKLDCTHSEAAEGTKMTEYSPYRETVSFWLYIVALDLISVPLYVAIWQFYRKKPEEKRFGRSL